MDDRSIGHAATQANGMSDAIVLYFQFKMLKKQSGRGFRSLKRKATSSEHWGHEDVRDMIPGLGVRPLMTLLLLLYGSKQSQEPELPAIL